MIVIAGAGIGGLALGCALRRAGRPFVILERAAVLEPVGAGITLSPNAMAALELLGVAAPIRAAGNEMAEGVICDRRGKVLVGIGGQNDPPVRIGHPAPRTVGKTVGIARASLQKVLLDAVGDAVQTGREVTGFAPHDGGITVSLANGAPVEGTLLVGADGLRSAVRRIQRGEEPLRYAGYTTWRALVDDVDLPNPRRFSESWGPGSRFGIVPLAPRRAYWFAVADAPAGQSDPGDPRPLLRARFAAWHAPIDRLIAATPPERIFRADIFDRPPIDRWAQDGAVLLGDAAHPMTPNLGQGGGQAIEDAVVLADALVREPTIAGALGRYEAQRLGRANRFVVRSLQMGQLAHVRGRPLRWLRDHALRMIPAKLAARSLARELDFRV
jgi:2-polyprenyl-6-methoxyphenol hydroxylase-like FAD-dependent oxidoreductase